MTAFEIKSLLPYRPFDYNMETKGKLLTDIDCENCGFTNGVVIGEKLNRCTECGRFASDDAGEDVCCMRHEIRNSPYPSGQCPRCEQERSRRAQEREMHQRRADPTMHNMVDAKRF